MFLLPAGPTVVFVGSKSSCQRWAGPGEDEELSSHCRLEPQPSVSLFPSHPRSEREDTTVVLVIFFPRCH